MKNLPKIDRHNTTFSYFYPKRPLKISPSQILNRYIPISLAVIGILALFIWLGQRNKDQHDWQLSYEPKSREPYGTAVAHDILRGYLPTQKLEDLKDRTAKSLPTDGVATSANYVFLRRQIPPQYIVGNSRSVRLAALGFVGKMPIVLVFIALPEPNK